jgi:hypothetical protein
MSRIVRSSVVFKIQTHIARAAIRHSQYPPTGSRATILLSIHQPGRTTAGGFSYIRIARGRRERLGLLHNSVAAFRCHAAAERLTRTRIDVR